MANDPQTYALGYEGPEVQEILEKSEDIGPATQSKDGLMSATDKTKLDNLPAGAQENVLEGVQLAGVDLDITEKKVNIPVDNAPTEGSSALIRSGAVAAKINQLGQDINAKVDKVTGKSLIDSEFASSQEVITSPEYLQVITDLEGKILEGIKTDGTKVIETPLETQVARQETIDNSEFIQVTTDSEGKIIEATKKDGKKVFYGGIEGVSEEIQEINNSIEELKEEISHINSDGSIEVTYNASNKEFEIRSYFSSVYDIVNTGKFYEDNNHDHNPCLNFNGTYLINRSNNSRVDINFEVDNIPAVGLTGSNPSDENHSIGYLGGNHGLFPTNKAVINNHGLSYDSIGKAFTRSSDSAIFYLVSIYDANTLQFVPDYSYNDGIEQFDVATKLEANDVIISGNISLTVGSVTRRLSADQLFLPSEVIASRKMVLDGKEITESGVYKGERFEYVETYDVVSPASYVDKLRELTGTLTQNPYPKDYYPLLTKLFRMSTDYVFQKDGCNLLYLDFIPLTKINISWFTGGLNVKLMQASSLGGSTLKYYMPKALPKTVNGVTYDYRNIESFGYPATGGLHYTAADSDTQNTIVDRGIEFVTDSNGNPIVGLHHGFIPNMGLGGDTRKDYVNEVWWIHTTGAVYPKGLEGSKIGYTLNIGEHYGYVTYRKYENVAQYPSGVISISMFEVNNKLYIYGDFEDAKIYQIDIPSKWIGKKVTILEKRSNVEVLNAFSSSPLMVKVGTDNTKQYGYFVAMIEN